MNQKTPIARGENTKCRGAAAGRDHRRDYRRNDGFVDAHAEPQIAASTSVSQKSPRKTRGANNADTSVGRIRIAKPKRSNSFPSTRDPVPLTPIATAWKIAIQLLGTV